MKSWEARSAEIREEFDCLHERTRSTKRIVAGGAIQYVHQCLKCGKPTTQAVAKHKAIAANGGREPPPFDDELFDKWNAASSAAWEQYHKDVNAYVKGEKDFLELQSKQWRKEYEAYQKTPQWAALKEKVLLRAQGMCEGCRDKRATVMHHLTYAHVFNELLFELVALCEDCHNKAHSHKTAAP